jgi:RimJ/RimL family protein N-acetyltransferase
MVPLSAIEIRTERLTLRSLDASDAGALLEIHADPLAMMYSNSEPWSSIDQAHGLISQSGQWLESGRHVCLGISEASSSRLLGTCTLYDIDRAHQRAEIGFILGPFAWRHGFMTEALKAVLAHAFGPLDLNRIEADTDPQNIRAARLLEALGFQKEGVLRERWIIQGRKSDAAMYGLLRSEWTPPASSEPGHLIQPVDSHA